MGQRGRGNPFSGFPANLLLMLTRLVTHGRERNGEKDKVGVKREINAAAESDVNWEAWRISRLSLNGEMLKLSERSRGITANVLQRKER